MRLDVAAGSSDTLRGKIWANGTATTYAQDLTGGLSQVLATTSGGSTTDYLYGQERLASLSGSIRTWYGTDGQGSVRQTLSDAGVVTGTQNYDPYGQVESGGTLASAFGYTGELQDSSTGNEYLRARWYQPGSGQLLGADPLLDQTGLPYAYAGDNPVNSADPSGDCKFRSGGHDYTIAAGGGDSECSDQLIRAFLLGDLGPLSGQVQDTLKAALSNVENEAVNPATAQALENGGTITQTYDVLAPGQTAASPATALENAVAVGEVNGAAAGTAASGGRVLLAGAVRLLQSPLARFLLSCAELVGVADPPAGLVLLVGVALVLGTLLIVTELSKPQPAPAPASAPAKVTKVARPVDTKEDNEKEYRFRSQIQGDDIKSLSLQRISRLVGGAAIRDQQTYEYEGNRFRVDLGRGTLSSPTVSDSPISVRSGRQGLGQIWSFLDKYMQHRRDGAYYGAVNWITSSYPDGRDPGEHFSYPGDSSQYRGVRMDVDNQAGRNFTVLYG